MGATIAAEIAVRHSSSPALIVENPAPTGLAIIQSDPRTKLLPVRLLFHDRLELEPKLRELKTPKLFLSVQTYSIDIPSIERTKTAYRSAAEPKEYLDLNNGTTSEGLSHYMESFRRFFDEHLTAP